MLAHPLAIVPQPKQVVDCFDGTDSLSEAVLIELWDDCRCQPFFDGVFKYLRHIRQDGEGAPAYPPSTIGLFRNENDAALFPYERKVADPATNVDNVCEMLQAASGQTPHHLIGDTIQVWGSLLDRQHGAEGLLFGENTKFITSEIAKSGPSAHQRWRGGDEELGDGVGEFEVTDFSGGGLALEGPQNPFVGLAPWVGIDNLDKVRPGPFFCIANSEF